MSVKIKITTPNMPASKRTEYALVKLSQDFMYAAKTGGNSAPLIEQLKNISYNELLTQLNNDNLKKAFWINIYNGFTQYFLKLNHGSYLSRNKFFKANQINIAGKEFSLDNIEHGILRRSKIKWSEGYLNKWFPSTTEKQLRVENLDYRIHFALNCGAESCPPIAFYDDENLNNQLTSATKSYLSSEAKYDTANNSLQLPKLMSWFRHDFGGKQKMLALIQSLNIVPAGKKPSISFKPYSWNLYLDNYKN